MSFGGNIKPIITIIPQFFVPQSEDFVPEEMLFQEDSAICHTTPEIMLVLHDSFPDCDTCQFNGRVIPDIIPECLQN